MECRRHQPALAEKGEPQKKVVPSDLISSLAHYRHARH
jgi:hypothetical protein